MIDLNREQEASRLKGSLLEFTRFFFKYITNRDFIVSQPTSRESHHIIVSRELTRLTRLDESYNRLIINLPPGFGKSVLVSHWIAWCVAQYPDSNFLYISYSHDLAAKHTAFIKSIISSSMFGYLFDVHVKQDSRAKDHFATSQGGIIRALGSAGSITGSDAGLPGLDRFSGAVVIDDPIKPDDAHSDSLRASVIKNYEETIRQRPRGINVPMVFIGQRLHEDDLAAYLLAGRDINPWKPVVLKGLDEAGNALYPEVMPKETLLLLQEKSPYVFASQYQQDPVASGAGLFKREWFVELDEDPKFVSTFIVADTAETDKNYNDATVFSFFGVYELESMGRKTGDLALHWLDCMEIRIEPKDLKEAFLDFYASCSTCNFPPRIACIEKKSTGVTLISVLKDMRGLTIREIERNASSGSKGARFLEMQPFIASRLVSINSHARHKELVLNHMSKITLNNTHRFDDIADTLADGIRLALIEKTMYSSSTVQVSREKVFAGLNKSLNKTIRQGIARNVTSSPKAFR